MNKALELVIDEPTEGHFFWTLINMTRPGEKPLVVDFAMGPLPSRAAAVAAGNASLHRNKTGGWEVPGNGAGSSQRRCPLNFDAPLMSHDLEKAGPDQKRIQLGADAIFDKSTQLDDFFAYLRAREQSAPGL